jgi:cold shock protein
MARGKIKKLVDRSFGFIEGEHGEVFFHCSALKGTAFESLTEGQVVEYTEGKGRKGPRADSVSVVD